MEFRSLINQLDKSRATPLEICSLDKWPIDIFVFKNDHVLVIRLKAIFDTPSTVCLKDQFTH